MVTKRWNGRLVTGGRDAAQRDPIEQALEGIAIPEEDSRLHARARVDFGPVQLKGLFWASIAGNFSIRIHVPRALQQQITGNGFVGSVLGSARITSDISERVGSIGQERATPDLGLFVSFHEADRGSWLVKLRVLRGGHLRVPVSSSAAAVHLRACIDVRFDEDVIATVGPIAVPSGSVTDLWRSVRDEVRTLLVQRVTSLVSSTLPLSRPTPRSSQGGEAVLRVWRETPVALRV